MGGPPKVQHLLTQAANTQLLGLNKGKVDAFKVRPLIRVLDFKVTARLQELAIWKWGFEVLVLVLGKYTITGYSDPQDKHLPVECYGRFLFCILSAFMVLIASQIWINGPRGTKT